MKLLTISAFVFTMIALSGTANANPFTLDTNLNPIIKEKKEQKKPQKKIYTVRKGDTLTEIAKKNKTTVARLQIKNSIINADLIKLNQRIVIPSNNEKLKKPTTLKPKAKKLTQASYGVHNNFPWGWCTYFAQSQRMDKQFNGNAGEWIRYANSSVPKVGAVAVNTYAAGGLGHVAYVLEVRGNRVLVKEMNWRGFGIISERWSPASYWSGYIY